MVSGGKGMDNDVKSIEKMTFEECYSELQTLVEQFEQGQMPLAESVDQFERGMLLLKRCNQQLNEAENRVEKLLRKIEPDQSITMDSDQPDYDLDQDDLPV
jgi:exodeoxyribonuclease VII small subunit